MVTESKPLNKNPVTRRVEARTHSPRPVHMSPSPEENANDFQVSSTDRVAKRRLAILVSHVGMLGTAQNLLNVFYAPLSGSRYQILLGHIPDTQHLRRVTAAAGAWKEALILPGPGGPLGQERGVEHPAPACGRARDQPRPIGALRVSSGFWDSTA